FPTSDSSSHPVFPFFLPLCHPRERSESLEKLGLKVFLESMGLLDLKGTRE
ncbi:hypothetical protein AMECASPLE_034557, partial [Ameca splendens]